MTTSATTIEPIELPDTRRTALIVLGVITALGLLLRLFAVLTRGMTYDESFSYLHYAAEPLAQALGDYSTPNNHLFHTLLMHLTTLGGPSPLAARLPALLAGTALIPAVYFLSRRLFTGPGALTAAALVACTGHLLDFSANARGYTLVALLSVLMALAAESTRTRRCAGPWVGLVLTAVLGLYTIPTMLYPATGIFLWLLLRIAAGECAVPRRWALLRAVIAAAAIAALTALLYLPVLLRDGAAILTSNSTVARVPYPELGPRLATMLHDTWQSWHLALPTAFAVLLATGVVVALVAHHSVSTSRVPLLPVLLAVSALAILLQGVAPFARVWIFLLPFYLVTAAAGVGAVASLLRHATPTAGIVLALGAALLWLLPAAGLLQRWQHDPVHTGNTADLYITRSHAGDFLIADAYLAEPLRFYCAQHDVRVDASGSFGLTVMMRTNGTTALPQRAWVVHPANDAAARNTALSAIGVGTIYVDHNVFRYGHLVVEELMLPLALN
jgi:hypothetical protein